MEATRHHGLLSRKRSFDDGGYGYQEDPIDTFGKRQRSRSLSSGDEIMSLDHGLFPRMRPPPTAYELDRINHHMGLEDFGFELGKAANAIFPNNKATRYRRVDVILLSWEKEDPELPVSIEINELADIFVDIYGFEVEKWLIPSEQSHNQLQKRVLEFLGDNDPQVLKIVYYAGHGKLTNHGQLAWTSILDSRKDRCPTAKWSGIQNTLEESQSDVLILLDCCASGICTTDEGNAVTELIAACPHNAKANGVGRFSFTHALILKLKALAPLPHFTVGYLYNTIFTEIQGWRNEDSRHKMVPIHLVLSQNNDRPRSIQLSKFTRSDIHPESSFRHPSPEQFHLAPSVTQGIGQACSYSGYEATQTSPSDLGQATNDTSSRSTSQNSPATSISPVPEYPRLLFSVRIDENIKPCDLSTELFSEWLRDIPTLVSTVRVEAGFASDSTLIIFSIPPSILAYLPVHPAILLLGTIRSRNIMAQDSTDDLPMEQCVSLKQDNIRLQENIDSYSLDIIEHKRRSTDSSNSMSDEDLEAGTKSLPMTFAEDPREDKRFPSHFNKIRNASSGSLRHKVFYPQSFQFGAGVAIYPDPRRTLASYTPYKMKSMPSRVQNQAQHSKQSYNSQSQPPYSPKPRHLRLPRLPGLPRDPPVNEQKTKGHVASACVPCIRAHLSCDTQRPCSRCLSNGMRDACIDIEHKGSGRPRLRDEQEPEFQAHSVVQASGNQMPRASDITSNDLRLLKQLDHDDMQEPGIIPAYLPEPGRGFACLTMEMQIMKATSDFLKAVGMVLTKTLFEIVIPSDQSKVFILKHAFGNQKTHILEDEAGQSNVPDLTLFGISGQELIIFQIPGSNEEKRFRVRFRLTKIGTAYFIIATLL